MAEKEVRDNKVSIWEMLAYGAVVRAVVFRLLQLTYLFTERLFSFLFSLSVSHIHTHLYTNTNTYTPPIHIDKHLWQLACSPSRCKREKPTKVKVRRCQKH